MSHTDSVTNVQVIQHVGLQPGRCTEYDRKKYVWKLLYIYMLGYEVEFGHKQAADLIPATRYRRLLSLIRAQM